MIVLNCAFSNEIMQARVTLSEGNEGLPDSSAKPMVSVGDSNCTSILMLNLVFGFKTKFWLLVGARVTMLTLEYLALDAELITSKMSMVVNLI